MKRTSPRRQPDSTGSFTQQVPETAADPSASAAEAPSRQGNDPPDEKPLGVGWGWRLARFLWGASFVFLFLYEIMMTLFRDKK